MDLILLFIPSTAPLESRILVQGRIPSRWLRSIRANFLNGSSFERIADSDPFSQVLLGAPRLFVVPEQLEDFLQVPSPHQRRVPAHQRREPLLLIVVKIPGILQQQPAGSFEARSFFTSELPPQFEANPIHRLVEMLDDMESVEQDLRVGARILRTRLAYAAHMSIQTTRSV